MPSLTVNSPKGMLRNGWSAFVDDYAIGCCWLYDGDLLAVGDAAGGVFGFEGKSGNLRWKHPEVHSGGLLAIAAHPRGTRLATTVQDGHVRIWDAKDGQEQKTIQVGNGWVEHAAWSANGKYLAVSMSRRVYVYTEDGHEVWQSDNHPSTVSALVWSRTGELATACYGRVSFFDATTGNTLETLEWKGSLVSMVLSPDGDIVACGSQDNSVHFWRRSTGKDSQMHGYPCKPAALAFDHAGTFLATGGGSSVTVWSFEGSGPEGTTPGLLELHVEPISALAFASRGRRIASGARDGSVAVWKLQDNGEGNPIGAVLLSDAIAELAWRPDDRGLAALDASGRVTVWRT